MPTEEVLANAKRKIFAEIKFEMDKRGVYNNKSS